MDIEEIRKHYARLPQVGAFNQLQGNDSVKTVFLQGLVSSAVPLFFSAAAFKLHLPLVFILQDADEAGYFYHDLVQIMGDQQVLFFPSGYRRAVKYGQRDSANEILRTEVLARITAWKNSPEEQEQALFVVTSPEALAEMVVSQQHLDDHRISLRTGQNVDVTQLKQQLRELGFHEEDYVYEPGQFASRGSIIDVYSYSCELPYRIDFFGDEIDTIRTFNVEDQLSKDRRTEVEIVPELVSVVQQKVPFLKYLPQEAILVMKDFEYLRDRIERIYNEGFSTQALQERMEGATEQEREAIQQEMTRDTMLCKSTQFVADASCFRHVFFGAQAGSEIQKQGEEQGKSSAILHFHISLQPVYHKNFELLRKSFEDYLLQGYTIYILADSEKQQQRLKDIFDEMSTDYERSAYDQQRSAINFTPVNKTLHEGFVDNDARACFFTDHQIFDRFHKYSLKSDGARAGKMALTMKELQEMEVGDFIVHVDYGIGKFGGLVRIPIQRPPTKDKNGHLVTADKPNDKQYQEVIRIIYQNNDKVDVSIHSLYKISKYRRSDTDEPPRLSVLGTGAWERMKEKAKKRIKDIARDLIRLYAKRRHEKGYAFSADNFMQHELEASFLYEDTPDQLKATQEVKADMERPQPMDRLICGDVGFGKTEVAVRAAFKAACDSKQVAVLVPTTVLAFQHYQTFRNRLKEFPVRVDYLTRARTAKQTKQVLADLEEGKIDIIIGTHKLLGKNVKWHDIGLLIIDEEQKFGVSTKEKLRKMKTNIDTLTMSATPIPRTLQFSLMGARDMSIMRTPPPNRYPVHTELCTFSYEVITDAINFEMSRNGQVYFVNNRISNLQEIANQIKKRIPDCRIAIGHGQMSPEELEKIIMGFINYDYDVLLSTTIVENGIDISNANTIIINDAHHFGLSDLHQMRGRVGRSNRKAFCYLLAPPRSVLTTDARRRLEALENFSDLGSGFNLAMQDLDIRGAGNLLGSEQSGFMEDLGYETYQKILSQAVTELKNEEFSDLYEEDIKQGKEITGEDFVDDCAVESDLEMYFPDTYVPGASERMLLYRELDNIRDDNALAAYRQRLVDRFGPVPPEGEELMRVVTLRRIGKRLGCERIILRQGIMDLQFVSQQDSPFYQSSLFGQVIKFVMAFPRRCTFKDSKGHRMAHITQVPSVEEAVLVLRSIEGMK
ncbi:MAG: transcription-repair coupling factor [Prevotella sp.]